MTPKRPSVFASGIFALAAIAGVADAQRPQPTQEDLVQKRDEKLKAPFLAKAAWTTDYDQARADAKKNEKYLLGYFTRSYAKWPPCDRLEASTLSSAEFAEFGKKVVLFCHITSQVDGDKHQDLLSAKGGQGFPYVVIMNASGDVMAQVNDWREVSGFEEALANATKEAARLADLRKKADAGDLAAAVELFEADLKASRVGLDEGRKRLAELKGVDAEAKARIEDLLVEAEFKAELGKAKSKDDIPKIAEHFRGMKASGRIPKGESAGMFWNVIFMDAETRKDLPGAEEAFEALNKAFADQPRAKMLLKNVEDRLKKLKESSTEKKEDGDKGDADKKDAGK